MGQVQFRSNTVEKERKPLRIRKSDDDYIRTISDPVFMDWEHRVANQKEVVNQLKNQHQTCPIQISDYLFISNASGVSNLDQLKSLGITHVLNVAGFPAAWRPADAYIEAGMEYKLVDALDEASYPMLDHHLEECLDFIESARAKPDGKVVVHCQAGCNRSGVICSAEHMLHTRSNVLETVLHCRKCRGNAFLTNPGFQGQLVALARREGLLGPAPGTAKCVVEQWLWRKVNRERNL
jgi:protein tyrosine phosphatase (PTP) superfamily phosphohydrolase (DUF442 family)